MNSLHLEGDEGPNGPPLVIHELFHDLSNGLYILKVHRSVS
jgi:hypothetical protein